MLRNAVLKGSEQELITWGKGMVTGRSDIWSHISNPPLSHLAESTYITPFLFLLVTI